MCSGVINDRCTASSSSIGRNGLLLLMIFGIGRRRVGKRATAFLPKIETEVL